MSAYSPHATARRLGLGALLAASLLATRLPAAPPTEDQLRQLRDGLTPLMAAVNPQTERATLAATYRTRTDGNETPISLRFSRFGAQEFQLAAEHRDYALAIERRADQTMLVLPRHKVAFVGVGAVTGDDSLAAGQLAQQLVSDESAVKIYTQLLATVTPQMAAAFLTRLAGLETADGRVWQTRGALAIELGPAAKPVVTVRERGWALTLEAGTPAADAKPAAEPPAGFRVEKVDRTELERLLVRGVRRALEIAAPAPLLVQPPMAETTVANGQLTWVEGQRLLLLWGNPQQLGAAHGRLVGTEARRCVDSVLYTVGLAETVRHGRWFLNDLRAARQRLAPFIPADHQAEIDALASASGIGREELQLANVFPELFHCSGFAAFGKATAGGKLYHGRVLDYMTEIGLQDCAAVMIVAPDGKHGFVNVGYAGFVGSVSGMNDQQVSLGEMGGGGQGKWDGVPMATLMRRALEECGTLDEVKALWQKGPRTCEYYFVFADGKGPAAVAAAARPEAVEFLAPGQDQPQLGKGLADVVLISADDRLATLRQRVVDGYGKLDVAAALKLMSRPVAMGSNLHDVLFVPQDRQFYVAQADRQHCAADRPYVKYDLGELLQRLAKLAAPPPLPAAEPGGAAPAAPAPAKP